MRTRNCPKCQGSMTGGLVMIDVSAGKAPVQWADGPIRRSWFWGLKVTNKPIDLTAWRCGRCGFVEHYAEP